jgi:hypothetical protein
MFFKQLIQCVKSCVTKVIQQVEKRLKQWTKPRTESLIVGTLADVIRGKAELIAENALLRQLVIILQRQVKRPHLTQQVGAYWFSWHAGHGVGKTRWRLSNRIRSWAGVDKAFACTGGENHGPPPPTPYSTGNHRLDQANGG